MPESWHINLEQEVQMTLINDNFNTGTSQAESEKVFIENRVNLLTDRVESLNKLCSDLDPYKDIPASAQEKLSEFGIYEYSDPFAVTNKLVVLLEESIEELQKLQAKQAAAN